MKIKLWIEDTRNGEVLEDLGTCLTDSPNRAVQMYEDETEKWDEKGYWAEVYWKDITDKAAASLGSRTSERKAKSSRKNGKLGGRPKKSE